MNSLVIDPNQLSLTESQVAALVVDENIGGSPGHLNIDFLRLFKLTNRLACKILCALCELNKNKNNSLSNSTSNGQPTNNNASDSRTPQLDLIQGSNIGSQDINYLVGRQDSAPLEEITLFAEYCRQNSISLQSLLQTFDDEDFTSDRIFRNTNYVLQPQKHSSIPPLTSFRRFWQYCTNLAATDKDGLSAVGRVFFTQVWQHNQMFQLNFIVNCIEQNLISPIFLKTTQQQANFSQIVPYGELLKCQPDFDALPELNNWKFQKLYQILIDFTIPGSIVHLPTSSNCFARVLEIFQWPLQYCPDLAVLGMLSVTGQASAAKVEILSLAIPTFLNASHPNAAIILHSIWSNDSQSSSDPTGALAQQKPNAPLTWSQRTLLQALSDHYTKSPVEEQQQRLSRILDVAQDIKTLFRLLDGTCYPFVIDLACLASRREYLKLDKWLMDKFQENGENFIRALNSFLTKRYLPLLNRTNKDSAIGPLTMSGPALPAETLAVMLTFLQQCVMPPMGPLNATFSELSQVVKNEVFELVGNSSIMLQRAPRHPPPGVATSAANDYNRIERLVGFPMDRSTMNDADKLQAEFEAKKLAQRTQRAPIGQVVPLPAPVTRPSIANSANIDNLLAAGNSENHPVPPEVIQDKVFFIVNNLSLINLKQKTEEFKELFGDDDTYYGWTAQYFSTKRAALEQNFQPLYANFLYELKNPKLIEAMTRETYRNIKHLLRLDKKADNINERTVLKNLGQWLGLLTLARNKPILHVDLDLKGLLVEAYHKGTQELLYVVPFLAEILKTTQKSQIFKPNNPFVLGLLRALVELRQQPNLKLNLEFQVEVLFNNLGVDLNKLVGQSNILNDEKYYSRIECQLGSKQISAQQSAQPQLQQTIKTQLQQQNPGQQQVGGMNQVLIRPNDLEASLSPLNTSPLMPINNPSAINNQVGHGMQANIATTPVRWSSKFKFSDLDPTNTATLGSLTTLQSTLPIFSVQPNAKVAVRPAIELAISEWLPSILEKSLKICLPTVEQIIKKDFALVPDETHMQRAAHYLVRHLVSYMAMILCRDPEQLEASLTTNLKVALARVCPTLRKDQIEHAALVIAADNLDLARAFIIKTVIERAIGDIDKLLQNECDLRRMARLDNHQYVDATHIAFHTKLVADGLRLKPAPTKPDEMRNYEEIGQNIAGFKRFDTTFNETNIDTTSPFNEISQSLNLQNIIPPTTSTISKASPMGSANIGPANMVNQLINNRVTMAPFNSANQAPISNFGINDLYILQQQLELQTRLAAMQSSNRNQSNYLVQQAIDTPTNTFSNTGSQIQNTNNSNALLQQRETPDGDPPGLVERTEKLLREWVGIHQSGQTVKMFPIFVQQMTAHGILKTDDLVTRFFRLSTEMCVESCYRLLATQPNGPNSLELRNKCYETLDAFTMLIVLLIKNSGSSNSSNLVPEPAAKINLLSKILSIIASVAFNDQRTRQVDFQHLAYYRILVLLFVELNLSPPILGSQAQCFNSFDSTAANEVIAEHVQFQVLCEFIKTLKILRPNRVPSFAFAWLDFLSHRLFVEKCLGGQNSSRPTENIYKGWACYAQLLIELIQFEAPYLRNVELPPSVDLLYKGTLKMFLVLLHDFPEFLCEYCYSLCDVIPCNAIQLRNLVLSAFPRKMRLPDPFTPNLKIDQLPEMSQPPKTGAPQGMVIPFKEDLKSFLKTKTPASFVDKLFSYLLNPQNILVKEKTRSLNVPLLNALVLYVGQAAISSIAPRPISMSTISNTPHMDLFQHLITTLDTEGKYLFLNAVANQLRYPNSHTHYFSSALLYMFATAPNEQVQEQITRVLVERLIIMRPHPWGLLVTFIELIKNPMFKFWKHEFVRCAPEIEKLFESVARSCCVQNSKSPDSAYRGS